MTTKLTLSVEKQVIKRAKKYAQKHNKSLSEIVSGYLEYLSQGSGISEEIDPEVLEVSDEIPVRSSHHSKISNINILRTSTCMNSIFVDTDVILDLFIRREPHHQEALRLFTHLKRSKTGCFTSPIVIANAYYILTKIRDKRYALDKMRKLRKLLSIAPIDATIIDSALGSSHKDFEDSIQYFCALRNGIKTIITRNTRDYPKAEITITNPGEYLSAVSMRKSG